MSRSKPFAAGRSEEPTAARLGQAIEAARKVVRNSRIVGSRMVPVRETYGAGFRPPESRSETGGGGGGFAAFFRLSDFELKKNNKNRRVAQSDRAVGSLEEVGSSDLSRIDEIRSGFSVGRGTQARLSRILFKKVSRYLSPCAPISETSAPTTRTPTDMGNPARPDLPQDGIRTALAAENHRKESTMTSISTPAWAILDARSPYDPEEPVRPMPVYATRELAETVARTQTGGFVVEVRLALTENVTAYYASSDSPEFLHDGHGGGHHASCLQPEWVVSGSLEYLSISAFPHPKKERI